MNVFMLATKEIEAIMHALTLAERPHKRQAWLNGGFRRIHARGSGALLSYWLRRLAMDTEAVILAEEVWRTYLKHEAEISSGPGSQLEKLLGRLGIHVVEGCKCRSRAGEMNRRGLEWCRVNRRIILGWLLAESRSRWPRIPAALFAPGAHLLLSAAFFLTRRSQNTQLQKSQLNV